jgi:hypothetical protein
VSHQKGLEIGFRNSHQPIEAMRDEKLFFDPAPNRAVAHPDALGDFLIHQHLNHFPAASPSPSLHRNVTIAATNSGLFRIFIGGCDSARWLV